jgi:hypothetical protein
MELDGVGRREESMGFDLWVKRSLKDRYGGVAREQIPQELIELLTSPGQDQFVGD